MSLDRLHRRLAVLMGGAALLAFAGGAGFEPVSASLAGLALGMALFWQPSEALSVRMEQVWMPVAVVLVLRALWHVFVVGGDVVIPVVDLLLLLLAAESLRSLDAPNDVRLYALSFALLLASTAYRPGILFGVAFVAYVTLATVALMVGHLRRQSRRHRVRDVRLGPGFLTATAALSGVTLSVSALVFLTFPRVSRGWAGRGQPPAAAVAGFADRVALGTHGSRILANPRVVLRVEFPDGAPASIAGLYWRGRSYDRFDGIQWTRSRPLPPSTAPTSWYAERWGGEQIRQDIYAVPLEARVLFGLHPVVDVEPQSQIQPLFDNAGDFTYWGSASPVYSAWSVAGRPPPSELRLASGGFTPARAHYTQLPAMEERVRLLADSLTRGLDNRYDQAAAIQRWLHREFTYTLQLPSDAREATVEGFLFERRAGHCEYFSTAMAVLLRTLDVPVREVNGFLGGEWNEFGQYLAITQNQAHSWVEVWFPGFGWVAFDPTPPGSGGGEAATSALWPGRFLLDGLQHRWGKWVLDYSLGKQSDLLARATAFLGGSEEGGEVMGQVGSEGLGTTAAAVVLLIAAGAVVLILRRRRRIPREVRLYTELRSRYGAKGLPGHEALGPLGFLERLRAEGRPGLPHARRLVDLYLEARFAGREIGEEGRARMSRSLNAARRALARTRQSSG